MQRILGQEPLGESHMNREELEELRISANNGFSSSQFELYNYLKHKDRTQAIKYLEMAALTNHTEAKLQYGIEVQDKDPEKALALFNSSARNSSVEADYYAAVLLERLADTPETLRKAFKRYLKSANKGSIQAAERLVSMYEEGVGCGFNRKQAKRWRLRCGLDNAWGVIRCKKENNQSLDL